MAQHILGAGLGIANFDVAHQIDELAQAGSCPGMAWRSPWGVRL